MFDPCANEMWYIIHIDCNRNGLDAREKMRLSLRTLWVYCFFFLLFDRIFVFRNTFSKRTNSFATHRFWFYAYLFRELFDLFSFWSNKKFELFMILSALRSKISFFIYSFVSASALTWTLTKKLLHTHEIGFGIGFSI